MAEEAFQLAQNGQEVEFDDLNMISTVGALADDHVLAEMLRLAPFSGAVAKAIIPFGHRQSAIPTVAPNGASGSVVISPFRFVVGSRDTAQNIGPRANWNDARSGIFTGANGGLSAVIALAANTTQQTRWDLVYAQLQVNALGTSVDRYVKDPTTEQVTVQSVPRTRVQLVSVAVQQGTPGAPPQKPALPPDGPAGFFAPLAYVRVPSGFSATSIIAPADIDEVMPFVPLSRVTGAATLVPANQQNKEGGTVLSTGGFGWTGAAGQRPGPYIPPTMAGVESLLIALDLVDGNPANWSHPPGSVVDDSRDWRNRLFRSVVVISGANDSRFAWDPFIHSEPALLQGVPVPSVLGNTPFSMLGQSVLPDLVTALQSFPPNHGVPLYVDATRWGGAPIAQAVALYVDPAGALRLAANPTSPQKRVFIWLDATGPFPNV